MTKEAKNTLVKTLVAIALMLLGVWGIDMGGKTNVILGGTLFIIGFIIMAAIYKDKWLYWWSSWK